MKQTFWKKRTAKKAMFFSIGILSVVAIALLIVSPLATIAYGLAFPLIIGGVELSEKEEAVFNALKEASKQNAVSKEDIQKMIKELDSSEALKTEMQSQLDTLGAELKAMKEKAPVREKSLGDCIKEAGDIMGKLSQQDKVQIKVPVSAVRKTTVTPSSLTSDTAGLYLPEVGQLATKRTGLANLFAQYPIGSDSHGIVYYMDQSTATRNAAARTVGNASAESVLAWTMYSQALCSITDSLPFAKEMVSRYSVMEAEIRNFINTNLLLELEEQLATGDGSAPDLKGIYTYASAFDSASYTGYKTKYAGLYDLILTMATEIEKNTKYSCDYVLINPADALQLTLEKDQDGNRINLPLLMGGEMKVKNVKVIETPFIAANTLVIGDFTKARRYFGDNITLEFGYNASGDFAKRILTLVGNMEQLLLVRNCETDAFLKSTDIATDLTNISATVA